MKAYSNMQVVSIAPLQQMTRQDGASKTFLLLTLKKKLSPFSPIYPWWSACMLLDLHVGNDNITCNNDWKQNTGVVVCWPGLKAGSWTKMDTHSQAKPGPRAHPERAQGSGAIFGVRLPWAHILGLACH